MKITYTLILAFTWIVILSAQDYPVEGLDKPVEILVDAWGIPHIYAETEEDLFFAQGWNAARDRLFQFEVWRRQATGTVAELLGVQELKRDIGTRLFMFRGDINDEMSHYHENGKAIITSYVEGVNAYIDYINSKPDELPLEFKLLDTKPQHWTPEVVLSRHQGLLGNIGQELTISRQVSKVGVEKVKEINYFHPGDPDLTMDPKIDQSLLYDDILALYNAYRRPLRFQPEDIIANVRNDLDGYRYLAKLNAESDAIENKYDLDNFGSNNWTVSGEHTASGYPMLANDPHRTQAVPSLRYMAHLVGPGWNVIGGGEPEIPGISIGHNGIGAWGLTVFRTDAEDLYVYDTNPQDHNQYKYQGDWMEMEIINEEIAVKGQRSRQVPLKYSKHGPIVYEDAENHKAYAVRCGWLEIGGSPYLASLRMNQSQTFEEFREACNYSNIPGENMIWADKEGNIGWQAVGIAPVRKNFSGMVPVPGDGSYEWEKYLEIKKKPNVYNPESGIFSTANQNVTPINYPYMDAIGFSWSDPYRGLRVDEMLRNGRKHTVMDMAEYVTDYTSLAARLICPLLKNLTAKDELTEKARLMLVEWEDHQLNPDSKEAAIYVTWERLLKDKMESLVIPKEIRAISGLQLTKVVNWLVFPDGKFGADPIKERDAFLLQALEESVNKLKVRLGNDMSNWHYGQEKFKHIKLRHPISAAVDSITREKFEVGPHPRGGNGTTVGSTGNNDNQSSGASFRVIIDTGDFDSSLFTNSPGQSGDPDSPFYDNLFDTWAKDKFFPLFYSREKVESVKAMVIKLVPKK
ncbi:MAG: penicillin acylase family protein [Bacteroidia bacterium]|nr:penicillin acylase family protein [Bacteroidia bacterium]